MLTKLNMPPLSRAVVVLYAIELLDEAVYGLHGAAMPLIQSDLGLTFLQIGLLTTVPGLVGLAVDPLIGMFGDTRWRRTLVRVGLSATVTGLALVAFGQTYAVVLAAFVLLYVASGAYVNLAEATLMDLHPGRTEQMMARWTLFGSLGVAGAPLVAAAAFGLGYGWRGLYLGLAGVAGVYLAWAWQFRFDAHAGADHAEIAPRELIRSLVKAFRQPNVWRWVVLTELADLMLDKLYDVTGLYFHTVVGVDFAMAALAAAVFTLSGLVGNVAAIPLLERVSGMRVLRVTSVAVIALYAAFLLAPSVWAKYVLIAAVSVSTAGWFAILRGRTFAALPGQSGMVIAVTSFANLSVLVVPTVLGAIADAVGLEAAMWVLLVGPVALALGLGRDKG